MFMPERPARISRSQGNLARWQGFLHCFDERRFPSRQKPGRPVTSPLRGEVAP
jgi:hypothetical protein